MAGDWIKMRINLVTHPKVMAIAEFLSTESEYQDWSTLSSFIAGYGGSDEDHRNERYAALRVTRYVTVCGLLRFWGYANEHARGEFIEFATLGDVDEVVQIPCFGKAMESVGWIREAEDKSGLELPNFAEFNAVAAERSSGAERQKRYRERKKADSVTDDSDVTRDVTVTPREEKRREEVKAVERASRLPANWSPGQDEIDFCKAERPDLNPRAVADQFRDYWVAQPGAKGRKTDWMATWRNWVRNQRAAKPMNGHDNSPFA